MMSLCKGCPDRTLCHGVCDKYLQIAIKKATERNIKIYDSLPNGWKYLGTTSFGFAWISNGKSRFGGEYEHGLLIKG